MGCNKEEKSKPSVNNYGRAVKYLGIFGGAQGISVFLSLVRNKCAWVLLGPSGLGIIALYNRTIQLFSDITGLSLSLSAVRHMSDAYSNSDEQTVRHCVKVVRSIALLTGIVGMLLLLVMSPLVSQWTFEGSGYYTARIAMLSPVVLFMAVSGGELAILRGVKQPGKIAMYTLWTAVSAVLATVPLYYAMGHAGIFPAILLVALLQMAGALFFSTGLYPYKASPFSVTLLRRGLDIVKLGAGYIYASILVSGSIWLICQVLTNLDGEAATGLFTAGYVFVGMLPSILFAAFDSDYYPRLSGLFAQKTERDRMVNEHIEIHLLVQVPVILCVVVLLPWISRLLYSSDFMPALQMTQIAVLALTLHVVTYPISFMPVSKGDTLIFAAQETVYNVSFVAFTLLGFYYHGWLGAGVGMAMARMLDLLVVYTIARTRYSFRLSKSASVYLIIALVLCLSTLYLIFVGDTWSTHLSFAVAGLSVALSLYALSRHGNFLTSLIKRIFRKRV